MRTRPARTARALLGVAALSLSLAACSGVGTQPAPSNPGGASTTAVIGASGGSVTSADGLVTLTVPPGAVSSDVTFGIAPAPNAPGGTVGSAYQLSPSGTTFAVPAVLSVDLTGLSLPPSATAGELRIETAVNGAWQGLFTSYDSATHTLSANLAHLSSYGVVALTGSSTVYLAYSATEPIVYDSGSSVDTATQQSYGYSDGHTVGMTAVSQPDLPTCPFAEYTTRPMFKVGAQTTWAAGVPPAGIIFPGTASSSVTLSQEPGSFTSSQVVDAAVDGNAPNGTELQGQLETGSIPGLIALVGEQDNPSGAARTVTAHWSATGQLDLSGAQDTASLTSTGWVYYRAANGSCHELSGTLFTVSLPVPASGTNSVQVPAGASKVWVITDTYDMVQLYGAQGMPKASGHLDMEVQVQVE